MQSKFSLLQWAPGRGYLEKVNKEMCKIAVIVLIKTFYFVKLILMLMWIIECAAGSLIECFQWYNSVSDD